MLIGKVGAVWVSHAVYEMSKLQELNTVLESWTEEARHTPEHEGRRTVTQKILEAYKWRAQMGAQPLQIPEGVMLTLDFSGSQLTTLPDFFRFFPDLQSLILDKNCLSSLPAEISCLSDLQFLSISSNNMDTWPVEIESLENLRTLRIRKNGLNKFPEGIFRLSQLQRLFIGGNAIQNVPPGIEALSLLETFELSDGDYSIQLPEEIGNLSNLKVLSVSRLKMPVLPELQKLTKLEDLSITFSYMDEIPAWIDSLSCLQRLNLSFNSLTALPVELAKLPQNCAIDVANNFLSGEAIEAFLKISENGPKLHYSIDDDARVSCFSEREQDVDLVPSIAAAFPALDEEFPLITTVCRFYASTQEECAEHVEGVRSALSKCGVPSHYVSLEFSKDYPLIGKHCISLKIHLHKQEMTKLLYLTPLKIRMQLSRLGNHLSELAAKEYIARAQAKIGGVKRALESMEFSSQNYKDLLQSIYSRFSGICIGEFHSDSSPKQFLVDHMEYLKTECNVKTLFLENILYDTSQNLLDEYFDSEEDTVPLLLKMRLSFLDDMLDSRRDKCTYTDLVKAAKQAGIRIVALDATCAVLENDSESALKDRIVGLNYVAPEIISRESEGGNYIALIGGLHGSAELDPRYFKGEEGPPGIAELIGVPFICIKDDDKANGEIDRNLKGKQIFWSPPTKGFILVNDEISFTPRFVNALICGYKTL